MLSQVKKWANLMMIESHQQPSKISLRTLTPIMREDMESHPLELMTQPKRDIRPLELWDKELRPRELSKEPRTSAWLESNTSLSQPRRIPHPQTPSFSRLDLSLSTLPAPEPLKPLLLPFLLLSLYPSSD